MFRGGLYATIALIALAINLAALGTNIAEWRDAPGDNEMADMRLTPWFTCMKRGNSTTMCVPHQEAGCAVLKNRLLVMVSFYIASAGILFFAILFAIMDHGNVHGFRFYGGVLLAFGLVAAACSIIGWALAISIVTESYCTSAAAGNDVAISDREGFAWRQSAFLLVAVTFLSFAMTAVSRVAPKAATSL
jgi:hypothetical protein